jgi:hypothetical protein
VTGVMLAIARVAGETAPLIFTAAGEPILADVESERAVSVADQADLRITPNEMASVCFYFQVHQPFRLRRYSVSTRTGIISTITRTPRSAGRSPTSAICRPTHVMLETIRKHEGRFRIAYSITGVALEQFQQYARR